MPRPKVSICITTYNRTSYLPKLLKSIAIQTYKNYNIIITDNSDDDRIERFLQPYNAELPITYYKNNPVLNMTGNWNRCFSLADGDWLKLIHDDDWFATETALEEFVKATEMGARFIFCGRNDYYENEDKYFPKTITQSHFDKISENPHLLFAGNVLGPPSVLMFHRSVTEYYDDALKWFVDLEYYITVLAKEKGIYIDKPLVNMSYNDTQVTNSCFNNPVVVIPEALYILKKHGLSYVTSIEVYDAFWRMVRNLDIRNESQFVKYSEGFEVPVFLKKIIKHQQNINPRYLKIGYFSKPLMALSYLVNKKNLRVRY